MHYKYIKWFACGSLIVAGIVYVFYLLKQTLNNNGLTIGNCNGLPNNNQYYLEIANDIDYKFSGFNENEQGIYDVLVELNSDEIKCVNQKFGKRFYWVSLSWSNMTLIECVNRWFDEPLKTDTLELINNALQN